MKRRQWETVQSDEAFAALFAKATVAEVCAMPRRYDMPRGLPFPGADLLWRLTDGTWLALQISQDWCESGPLPKDITYSVLHPA